MGAQWHGVAGDEGFCPICWEPVECTLGGSIPGHFDTISRYCRASYEPFYITMPRRPRKWHG